MSETPQEGAADAIGTSLGDTAAFAELMDFMVSDASDQTPAEGDTTTDAPAAGSGQPSPAAEGTPSAGAAPAAPATGDPAQPAVPTGGETQPVGDPSLPDAVSYAPKWGEMASSFEQGLESELRQVAFSEAQEEHGRYFEAVNTHPRLLVGQEVPSLQDDGEMIRIADEADAKSWQDALKGILVSDLNTRVARLQEESAGTAEVIHASIDLFRNNPDLVPGTRQFDKELADRVAKFAEHSEIRIEGKLHGWSMPVQPLVAQLRAQLTAERSSGRAAPALQAAAPAAPVHEPQGGILSQAGAGGDQDKSNDFGTLFGTLGLPDLHI